MNSTAAKDWQDMTPEEQTALETEWQQEPGYIDYVIAHLQASPEDREAAVRVLQEIEAQDPDAWEQTTQQEILYLLAKDMQ